MNLSIPDHEGWVLFTSCMSCMMSWLSLQNFNCPSIKLTGLAGQQCKPQESSNHIISSMYEIYEVLLWFFSFHFLHRPFGFKRIPVPSHSQMLGSKSSRCIVKSLWVLVISVFRKLESWTILLLLCFQPTSFSNDPAVNVVAGVGPAKSPRWVRWVSVRLTHIRVFIVFVVFVVFALCGCCEKTQKKSADWES